VCDLDTNEKYAMKVEFNSALCQCLALECRVFEIVQQSLDYFPQFVAKGSTAEMRDLVMELLGPSVSHMRKAMPKHRFSRLTLVHLAYHMFCCAEAMHKLGLLHRDFKPANFLLRVGREHPVVLIDFGLSGAWRDRLGGHIKLRTDTGFVGTCRYASVQAHESLELSRRDDLISWFYSLVDLADGKMPWPGKANKELSHARKMEFTPRRLCHALPDIFVGIVTEMYAMGFYDEPDYDGIKQRMHRVIDELGGMDAPFDWEELPKNALSKLSKADLVELAAGKANQQKNSPDSDLYDALAGERRCTNCEVA
jgi:serine/threonine protein kinase